MDSFYSECDRLGILVTQDFLMACGTYPEDDKDFLDNYPRDRRCRSQAQKSSEPCLVER